MRPTIEIILPISKWKISLAKHLTYGEDIEINKSLMAGVKIDVPRGEGGKIPAPSLSPEVMSSWQRQKLLSVVKKITDNTGKEYPVTNKTFDDMDKEDGLFIEAEVEKILSAEKKS